MKLKNLSNPTTDEELPIELECFLITWGFFESDRAPGSIRHAQISKPKVKKTGAEANPAWVPSAPGEQPPF